MDRKCKTCAWWDAFEHSGEGQCRVDSPKSCLDEIPWPHTGPADWCRHWSITTGWDDTGKEETQTDLILRAAFLLRDGLPNPDRVTHAGDWTEARDEWLKDWRALE